MAQAKPRLATDAQPEYDQCVRDALALLQRSADEWAQGNPEEPSTETVLKQILKIFQERKFLRRPT